MPFSKKQFPLFLSLGIITLFVCPSCKTQLPAQEMEIKEVEEFKQERRAGFYFLDCPELAIYQHFEPFHVFGKVWLEGEDDYFLITGISILFDHKAGAFSYPFKEDGQARCMMYVKGDRYIGQYGNAPNEEGRFEFKGMMHPDDIAQIEITFNFIGFEPITLPLSEINDKELDLILKIKEDGY